MYIKYIHVHVIYSLLVELIYKYIYIACRFTRIQTRSIRLYNLIATFNSPLGRGHFIFMQRTVIYHDPPKEDFINLNEFAKKCT